MSIAVLKFGGTSLADNIIIDRITNIIKQKFKEKKKIIVVVSAMSGITNKLISQFVLIDNNINNPEYDSLISTGEQCSSAIVCSTLKKKK